MERGLVDVEIMKKGDGTYSGGAADEVQIKTTKGDFVRVPERDVIARKPNPEVKI